MRTDNKYCNWCKLHSIIDSHLRLVIRWLRVRRMLSHGIIFIIRRVCMVDQHSKSPLLTSDYCSYFRFGYPDETYLTRVKEELANVGITVDMIDWLTDRRITLTVTQLFTDLSQIKFILTKSLDRLLPFAVSSKTIVLSELFSIIILFVFSSSIDRWQNEQIEQHGAIVMVRAMLTTVAIVVAVRRRTMTIRRIWRELQTNGNNRRW